MSYLYYLMMHIRRRFFARSSSCHFFCGRRKRISERDFTQTAYLLWLSIVVRKKVILTIYFWLSTSVIPHSANRQVLTVRKFSVYTKWATSFVYPTRYSIILSGRVTSPCGNWGIWQGPAKDSETWLLPTRRAGSVASAKSSLSSLKRKLKTSKSPSAMLRGVRCFW